MKPRLESDCLTCGLPIKDWTREEQYELCQACEMIEYQKIDKEFLALEKKRDEVGSRIRHRHAAAEAKQFVDGLKAAMDRDRADTVDRMHKIAFGPFGSLNK